MTGSSIPIRYNAAPSLKGTLRKRMSSSLVLVKPPGFSGHFTAWLPVFDYAYGRCIEAFMASGVATRCNPPPLSNSDFRSIVELKQVTNPDDKRITAAEPLVGRKFVAYTLSPKVTHHYEYLSAAQRKHMQGIGLRNESIAFRNELHCVDGVCRKLIEWSNSEVLEFDDKSGKVVGWWVERR